LVQHSQEKTMRNTLRTGGFALALCAGVGFAAAQNNPPSDQNQQPSGPPAAEQKPVPAPRLPTQPPGMEADNAKPTMLQPEHSATPDKIAEPVPGATRQTEPSTRSAENAAQDKLPTIAFQLPLTDEQKSKIAASLAKASAAPGGTIQANVAQSLPSDVMLQQFPADATAVVPDVARYKYVKLSDRVLIVDPPFGIVVGEIKK
jgi:hypothetical protein